MDGEPAGAARSLRGLAEIMRRADWTGMDEIDVADSPVVEWHGGGPELW
ncbi:hypothetical protein ACFTY8_38090 [Streptomyces mirabilis]